MPGPSPQALRAPLPSARDQEARPGPAPILADLREVRAHLDAMRADMRRLRRSQMRCSRALDELRERLTRALDVLELQRLPLNPPVPRISTRAHQP